MGNPIFELSGGRALRLGETFDAFGGLPQFTLVRADGTIIAQNVKLSRPDGIENNSNAIAFFERADGGFEIHTSVFPFNPDDRTAPYAVESFSAAGVSEGPAVASGLQLQGNELNNDVQRAFATKFENGDILFKASGALGMLNPAGEIIASVTTEEDVEGPATIVLDDGTVMTIGYSSTFPFLNDAFQPSEVNVNFYSQTPVNGEIVSIAPTLNLSAMLNNFTQEAYTSFNGSAVNSIDMAQLSDGTIGVVFGGHERTDLTFNGPRTAEGVYFARINADGTVHTPTTLLIEGPLVEPGFGYSGLPGTPEITALNDGRYAVTYQIDSEQRSGDDTEIRVYSADGTLELTREVEDRSAVDVQVFGSGEVLVVFATSVEVVEGFEVAAPVGPLSLVGDDTANMLNGDIGNDTLLGNGGDDTLDGGDGNDLLGGGAGNDRVLGGAGNDTVYGGLGDDFVGGGFGNDLIYGSAGNNQIYTGFGDDTVIGGSGNDSIFGAGDGSNRLLGNDGFDFISGGNGGDLLGGGAGNDTVLGGIGDDTVYGGLGNDFLGGSNGNDALLGGSGSDTIYAGLGNDFVGGGEGNDAIVAITGTNRIYGGVGDDTVYGGTGRDVITGGPGADLFVFNSVEQIGIGAGRDVITDFTSGEDKITLALLDTQFNGSMGLSGGGQSSFYYFQSGGLLIGDGDGNGAADWVIELSGAPTLTEADFIL